MFDDLGPTTDNARNKKSGSAKSTDITVSLIDPTDPDTATYVLDSKVYYPGTYAILLRQLSALRARGLVVTPSHDLANLMEHPLTLGDPSCANSSVPATTSLPSCC